MFKHVIIALISFMLCAFTVSAKVNVFHNESMCIYADVGISDALSYNTPTLNETSGFISYNYWNLETSSTVISDKEHVYPLGNNVFLLSKYYALSFKDSYFKLSGTEVLNSSQNIYNYFKETESLRYCKLAGVEVPTV